jgi:hypothetical protein
MDNLQRRTCATEFKTLDGERRIPTEAELDHMLYELVRDKLTPDNPNPNPGAPSRPRLSYAPRPASWASPSRGHARERPNGSATTCSRC